LSSTPQVINKALFASVRAKDPALWNFFDQLANAIQGLTNASGGVGGTTLTDIINNITNIVTTSTGAVGIELPNDSTLGTGNNLFCTISPLGKAIFPTATQTSKIIGAVDSGGGISGNATIAIDGIATIRFDSLGTIGNYVILSPTLAGFGQDAGNTYPTSGQVLGRILNPNSKGINFYDILIFGPEILGYTPGGGSGIVQSTQITNDTSGTTNKLFCIITTNGKVITALTTTKEGIVGPVTTGGGTSGLATIAISGIATVTLDNTGVKGDYVIPSTITAGQGHDFGSAYPASGQVLGIVLSNVSGSDYSILLFGPEIIANTTRVINYTFDGQGVTLVAGTSPAFAFAIPQGGKIKKWSIASDGTCTIEVYRKAAGTATPGPLDTINTSGLQLISAGTGIQSSTLTDFTSTTLVYNDWLVIALTVVSGATQVNFGLEVQCP
jgi:hypothetical protein